MAQTYEASTSGESGKSTANCGVISSRSEAEDGYRYAMGSTIKVKAGYKIRASETATTSLYAVDSLLTDFELPAFSAGAMSLFGSTLALTAAVIATLMAF